MSSSGSSSPSPSPSPTTSTADIRTLPTLERLVSYFVAAKRALGTAQHVEQATQLVTSSRSVIEDIAVVGARNDFSETRIARQTEILHTISRKIVTNADEVSNDFQSVVERLDVANNQLQATITSLKEVIVDASLNSGLARDNDDGDDEEEASPKDDHHATNPEKTLFDYVDEAQYNEISSVLKAFIDNFHESRDTLEGHIGMLNTNIQHIDNLISNKERPDSPTVKSTLYDEAPLPVAEAFAHMEEHAGEMANLLQSLISHYDLCVSALKHTEGGREAAREAVLGAVGGGDASNDEMMEESLYAPKVADSISKEERSEILRIIEGDAAEVEEVTEDLKSRGAEIEQSHRQLTARADAAKSEGRRIVQAVKLLRRTRDALPIHIEALEQFKLSWTEIRESIDTKTQDLASLTAFYDEFIVGYEKLLREVERRKSVEAQMQRIAEKAQRELDKLYETDRVVREEFVEDVGSFLPSDLWPGVVEHGVRWHLRAEMPGPTTLEDQQQGRGIEIA